jgi:hypothetical protein
VKTSDGGASVVEYALLLGAMALGLVVALDTASSQTKESVERGHVVMDDESDPVASTTSSSLVPTSIGSSTTFPTTSTTTSTSTTTTTFVTTTTTAQNHAEVPSTSAVWTDETRSTWNAYWVVEVTKAGSPVPGAVVTAKITPPGGTSTTPSCTTGPLGRCTLVRGAINANKTEAGAELQSVTAPWDGQVFVVSIARPA